MTVTSLNIPQGVPSNGMVRVDFAPEGTFADRANPTLAELNSPTVVHVTCHVFPFAPQGSVTRTEKRRMCSVQAYEILGATAYTIEDITYVYDVQDPESVTNEAYAAMVPGTTGDLVFRWGVAVGEDHVADELLDLFPVRLGPQNKMPPEADDELIVSQPVAVVGNAIVDVALAAA